MPPPLRFDEFSFGFSWTVDEPLQRTSHAVVADGRVWLIDPMDDAEALGRAATLGEPAGVIQLLDRHRRGCALIASRLNVAHVKAYGGAPAGPFEVIPVLKLPVWKESALWWAQTKTLVIAEAVGTHPMWAPGSGPAGIHPVLRIRPPRGLASYRPEHLLVGHGTGVHGREATTSLGEAFAKSRRDIPRMLLKLPSMR